MAGFSKSAVQKAYATFEREMQAVEVFSHDYQHGNGVKAMSANSNTETEKAKAGYPTETPSGKEAPKPAGYQRQQHPTQPKEPGCNGDEHMLCAALPDLKRLNYFYGQMLGVPDFQTEQHYFREKLKLHNRCLHGYGVVCGLRVVPEPMDETCLPAGDKEVKEIQQRLADLQKKWEEVKQAADKGDQAAQAELVKLDQAREELRRRLEKIRTEECDEEVPVRVIVECGFALDCEGNELIVREPFPVDLWRHLGRDDRNRVYDGERTLYLSLCYCQQPTDPARPVLADSCGASSECNYGKLRDSVKVRVTVDPPENDKRCATCCESCCDACVLLARIDDFHRGWPLEPKDIHNEVRRPVSTYVPTTITGISWTDGAEYTEEEAEALLAVNPHRVDPDDPERLKGGLLITLSRKILTRSIKPGVIDVWVVQGGGGRAGDIFKLDVEYVDLPDPTQQPTVDRIRFRTNTDESPNPSDRVMIFVRAPRLLDECCRPVEGSHTGGRVPFVDDEEYQTYRRETDIPECISPPPFGYGPWTSGPSGANFESWFYIKPNPKNGYKRK